jgi:hypothetical protein
MQWTDASSRTWGRLAGAALVVALGPSLAGCTLILREFVALKRDYVLSDPTDKKSPRDRFAEWRGKKKPGFPGGPAFGIAVAPLYLRAPFTWDQTVGIFDPDELAGSADTSGCIELDEEGFFGDPGHFFFMCLDYLLTPSPGVRVRTNVDANEMFYPSVYGGVLRFAADVSTLSFQFQPLGASTFDTITSTAIVDPALQWFPSVGAIGLYKGGVMDFDDAHWSNTPPSSPTLEEQIAWGFEEAMRFLNEACTDLDGFVPDPVQAGADIQASFSYITQARSDIALLPDPRLARKTEAKLDCLDKNAGKALEQVGAGNVDRAIGKIEKGLRCGGEGLVLLRDFRVDF